MKRVVVTLVLIFVFLSFVVSGQTEETEDPGPEAGEVVEAQDKELLLPDDNKEAVSLEQEDNIQNKEEYEKKESNAPEDVIVLSVSELLAEQERDIERAKELYEKRWIELTGKVVSVTHGEYREATRTFMGKTTHFKYGETRYEINGVTIESALIYWLAVKERFEQADVIVEMDIFLCPNDEQTGYVYYPQHSTITVVAYCASIGEKDIVFTDGRYPK